MIDSHFAQKLKKTRSDLAITQQQLADRLHVSRKTVSGWETGRNRPDIDMLRQMARIYHLSLDELVSGAQVSERQKVVNRVPISSVNRITINLLDIILTILLIERFTQDTTHYDVFILIDWVFVLGVVLRLLMSRWGLKVIHSVHSPVFLVGYALLIAVLLYSSLTNLFTMGFVFQFVFLVVSLVGIINFVIIGRDVISHRKLQ